VAAQQRGAFEFVARWISTHGPTPPVGADRAATLIGESGPQCRSLDGVSFYYQVTFADSGIDATASALATSENLRRIRDTVIAQALAPVRSDIPLPNLAGTRSLGVPVTSQFLVSIFSHLGER